MCPLEMAHYVVAGVTRAGPLGRWVQTSIQRSGVRIKEKTKPKIDNYDDDP